MNKNLAKYYEDENSKINVLEIVAKKVKKEEAKGKN